MTWPARPALAAALIALTGCFSSLQPKVKHLAPPPVEPAPAPPVPLRIGVHMAPEFTGAWWASNVTGPIVPVGADSQVMLKAVLGRLLGQVPEVAAPPPFAGAPPDADLILVPSLADFSTYATYEKPAAWHAVTWRFALFEQDGDLVSAWTVRGVVTEAPRAAPPAPRTANPFEPAEEPLPPSGLAHAGENLADAARRLAARLREDAHVDQYLARRAAGGLERLEGLDLEAAVEDRPVEYPGTKPTLFQNGFVQLRVRLVNRSAAAIRLDGLYAQLRLADGRVLHRVGPALALGRLSMASSLSRQRQIASYGGFVGALTANVSFWQEASALPLVRAQLDALALEPSQIGPGGALEGELVFLPQVGGPAGGPATLELWATDTDRRTMRATRPLVLPSPPQGVTVRATPAE